MSVQIWRYADSTTVLEGKQRYIKERNDELEIAAEHVGMTINEKKTKVMIQIIWGRHNGTLNFGELQIWSAVSIYICGQLCDEQQ